MKKILPRRVVWLACALMLISCLPTPSPMPLATAANSHAPTTAPTMPLPQPATSRAGMVLRDVTYCSMDGQAMQMDIIFPPGGDGPWPVVLLIHGGGWVSGNKQRVYQSMEVSAIVNAGYIAAAVNYRLAPEHPFPAQIEDVKCAVRHLRAQAGQYNLDPNRIAAIGSSAGGHLAALLGAADEGAGWDVGEWLDLSSRVQAVVSLSGPSDLAQFSLFAEENSTTFLFGTAEASQENLARASPTSYLTPDDPPFLLVHGDRDPIVEVQQSILFHERLHASGVLSKLIIVQNGNHALEPVKGEEAIPSRDEVFETIIQLLGVVLNGQ